MFQVRLRRQESGPCISVGTGTAMEVSFVVVGALLEVIPDEDRWNIGLTILNTMPMQYNTNVMGSNIFATIPIPMTPPTSAGVNLPFCCCCCCWPSHFVFKA